MYKIMIYNYLQTFRLKIIIKKNYVIGTHTNRL